MPSEVWKYFESTPTGARCKLCGKERNRRDKSTSTFWQHLRRFHHIEPTSPYGPVMPTSSTDTNNFLDNSQDSCSDDMTTLLQGESALLESFRNLSRSVLDEAQQGSAKSDELDQGNSFNLNSFISDCTGKIKNEVIDAPGDNALSQFCTTPTRNNTKVLKRGNKARVDDIFKGIMTAGDSPDGPNPKNIGDSTNLPAVLSPSSEAHPPGSKECKRSDYITWDEMFMGMALIAAQRSKDPSTQVGAVIVNQENIIIGIGYNGMPTGCSDDELPWGKASDDPLQTKYPFVCHAEMNAILNKNSQSLKDCTIYSTMFPCNECAKLIIQSRIKHVVYLSDKPNKVQMIAAKQLFDKANVFFTQFLPTRTQLTLNFMPVSPGS
ncbi:cytidine and deoxycytidylate deaminase zinc-binding region domain-containing protein [Ditylenchus destructor]|uniref:Probable deoxycytidylate deaminase n=1 Tax=Ditylenchus destructor TaxID=166010 RepID=A0AAD4R751_9BILA|nr:cytidine and deoxycytidylate deaminase zinc-binding region domain-containing protein [Ditylenchus destructor]